MDYSDAPQVLRDFLIYHETICGHSKATVDQYYLDLRMFLRFLKLDRGLAPRTAELDEISIADVDISFLHAVTLTEVYSFLAYLSRDRVRQPNAHEPEYGLSASSRARKIAAIRSFFKYLTVKAKLLEENPVQDLDSPKIPKTLPHYLTLEESKRLLSVVDGKNKERDYCILCIFLNCGLRISELVGLNLQDDHGDSLRIVCDYPGLRGVFHCFSGSVEMARELLRRGWYLGFDGPITYKNAVKALDVIAACPTDRMLLETDSPYLSPVPNRGKRNDSRNLPYIAARIAEIKSMTTEEVAEVTLQNGKQLFGL